MNFKFGTSLTCLYMTEVILPAACSQSEHKKQLFVIMQQRQGLAGKTRTNQNEKHSRFPLCTHVSIKYVPKNIWHNP